jgi:hypothetical protein
MISGDSPKLGVTDGWPKRKTSKGCNYRKYLSLTLEILSKRTGRVKIQCSCKKSTINMDTSMERGSELYEKKIPSIHL